jgi:phosphatidylglycerophosphate synthase
MARLQPAEHLTYGRILAVPLVVLCFFLEGRLQSRTLPDGRRLPSS